MQTRVELNIDRNVVDFAEQYAKSKNTDLSSLVEEYFNSLNNRTRKKFSPQIEKISGVIQLDENYNYKEDIADYLTGKY